VVGCVFAKPLHAFHQGAGFGGVSGWGKGVRVLKGEHYEFHDVLFVPWGAAVGACGCFGHFGGDGFRDGHVFREVLEKFRRIMLGPNLEAIVWGGGVYGL
jgi:hypothetical protein